LVRIFENGIYLDELVPVDDSVFVDIIFAEDYLHLFIRYVSLANVFKEFAEL
jgi:hypothetical protein